MPEKKIADRLREAVRRRGYSIRTEQACVNRLKRFILFHHKRHPKDMGLPEVEAFLTHLAVDEQVAASSQSQALSALLFLDRQVPHQDLDPLDIR